MQPIKFLNFIKRILATVLTASCSVIYAADLPVELTTEEDHARTLSLLNITSLRRGANGSNPEAENYANYDESNANVYPNLPDPLLGNNRKIISTPEQWWSYRRPEIVELFDREIYGRLPEQLPGIYWQVVSEQEITVQNNKALRREIKGIVDNSPFPSITVEIKAILVLPENAENVPLIMQFSGGRFLSFSTLPVFRQTMAQV